MSIEWAAGLFEGEGCVSIARRRSPVFKSEAARCTPVLALAMTDLDVVERFAETIGCGYISERKWHRENGHKPSFRWQTRSHAEVERAIDLLYEHMGPRRRARMDEVLVLLEAKRLRRIELGREQLGGKRKTIVRDAAGRYA